MFTICPEFRSMNEHFYLRTLSKQGNEMDTIVTGRISGRSMQFVELVERLMRVLCSQSKRRYTRTKKFKLTVSSLICIGVFFKWSRTFTVFGESRESGNHCSMNLVQFKDPVSLR